MCICISQFIVPSFVWTCVRVVRKHRSHRRSVSEEVLLFVSIVLSFCHVCSVQDGWCIAFILHELFNFEDHQWPSISLLGCEANKTRNYALTTLMSIICLCLTFDKDEMIFKCCKRESDHGLKIF